MSRRFESLVLNYTYNGDDYPSPVGFRVKNSTTEETYEVYYRFLHFQVSCDTEGMYELRYSYICVRSTQMILWEIPNVTQSNHGDVWSVITSIDEEPLETEPPSTTVFVKGEVLYRRRDNTSSSLCNAYSYIHAPSLPLSPPHTPHTLAIKTTRN